MLKIIVQKDNLSSLDKLKQILEDRQSSVLIADGNALLIILKKRVLRHVSYVPRNTYIRSMEILA